LYEGNQRPTGCGRTGKTYVMKCPAFIGIEATFVEEDAILDYGEVGRFVIISQSGSSRSL
jgi:hypothetical protein